MAQTANSEERDNGGGRSTEHSARQLRAELGDLDAEVRDFVREKPLLALGLAIAAGYVVGRMLSRL
jgi:hypothetical protein